jgi:glycine hydroxymethyltransferase
MKEQEMEKIAELIDEALSHGSDELHRAKVSKAVKSLCDAFPLYSK